MKARVRPRNDETRERKKEVVATTEHCRLRMRLFPLSPTTRTNAIYSHDLDIRGRSLLWVDKATAVDVRLPQAQSKEQKLQRDRTRLNYINTPCHLVRSLLVPGCAR